MFLRFFMLKIEAPRSGLIDDRLSNVIVFLHVAFCLKSLLKLEVDKDNQRSPL